MSADYTTGALAKMKERIISTEQKFGGGNLNTRRSADPGSTIPFGESSELGEKMDS